MVGYAKRRKSLMQSEKNIVVIMRRGLCYFSGTVILLSIQSTVFMAGKAIKTSIAIEKTSVRTMSKFQVGNPPYLFTLLFQKTSKQDLPR